ncbi:hypothetical protein SAMN04489760_12212 [Syntrophus gentianae]|uniref:Uncharacterized protein n=1 Tax=Syntrophus gentianae TaxID=43775 RepID=A0A1H7ZE64_9BACT|nr:hypothetical protein [Syntrophus gentianae]SEM55818.1 hypothetical protein SAMN04489760_12212 [Syntrophus gentianae]
MAEIKSTLDLIMERTKGLTMTEEEKKALHSRELRGRVKGWVQKCLDGTLDLVRLQEEIEKGKATEPELLSALFSELLERIDPDGENDLLFQIMEGVLRRDAAPLRGLIGGYEAEHAEKTQAMTVKAKNDLAQRGISGSAVLPNLDRDLQWKRDREQLKALYAQRIRSAAEF